MMNFVVYMMNFVFKMMNFCIKSDEAALLARASRQKRRNVSGNANMKRKVSLKEMRRMRSTPSPIGAMMQSMVNGRFFY